MPRFGLTRFMIRNSLLGRYLRSHQNKSIRANVQTMTWLKRYTVSPPFVLSVSVSQEYGHHDDEHHHRAEYAYHRFKMGWVHHGLLPSPHGSQNPVRLHAGQVVSSSHGPSCSVPHLQR